MYYQKIGDCSKRVVLFLHGWGADLTSFAGVTFLLPPPSGVSYLLVDFCGFGKSPEPQRPYTIFDYAVDVKELLCKLKIDKVTIVGHSFGGRVGIILASKYKSLVEKLVLVDSAGIIEGRGLLYKIKIFRYKLGKKLVALRLKKKNFDGGSSDYKALKTDIMRKTFVNVVNTDLKELAKEIRVPTVLIWGRDDDATTIKSAKKFNKLIKNSKLQIIENAGHYCFVDKPTEFVYILYESLFL